MKLAKLCNWLGAREPYGIRSEMVVRNGQRVRKITYSDGTHEYWRKGKDGKPERVE
jgi:hypothetical protein